MSSRNDNLTLVAVAGSETMLASPKGIGDTTISISSATGWPTTTGVIFGMRRVDNTGEYVPGTYTEWVATLSGTTLSVGSSPSPLYGTDQAYAADGLTQLYVPLSASRENRIITALLASLNQDGSLQGSAVLSALTANPLSSSQITTNGVAGNNLSATAISLAYESITSSFSTSSTTDVQIPGLGATVTVPAGGRNLKVTCYSFYVSASNSPKLTTMRLWSGTVGSSSILQTATVYTGLANQGMFMNLSYVLPNPMAGSYTFNLSMQADAVGSSTSTISAASNSPAFMLVELI